MPLVMRDSRACACLPSDYAALLGCPDLPPILKACTLQSPSRLYERSVAVVFGGVAVSAEFVRRSASRARKEVRPPVVGPKPHCGACLPPRHNKTWVSSPCASPSTQALALSPDFTWH